MTKAVESGMPKLLIEEAAARRQSRIETGEEVIVGVNCFQCDGEEEIETLDIDTESVLRRQLDRLSLLRSERNEDACADTLEALRKAAGDEKAPLLAAAVKAARARATVGEISGALEEVFSRYKAEVRSVSGVYGASFAGEKGFDRLRAEVESFAAEEGRRPRIMVVKLGQDGHDRGAKVIATALADLGFDVDMGPLFQEPEEAARQALENDVHAVGVSTMAAAHGTLVPRLTAALGEVGAPHIVVVCGGIVPPRDHGALREAGVAAIYGPGTNIQKAALEILQLIRTSDRGKGR